MQPLQVIWDYLRLNQVLKKADCIVGFGNFNTDIARHAAELYHEESSVSVIVGDFQRIDLYAKLGYQLPQHIPDKAWEAFYRLVEMGCDKQLAK